MNRRESEYGCGYANMSRDPDKGQEDTEISVDRMQINTIVTSEKLERVVIRGLWLDQGHKL